MGYYSELDDIQALDDEFGIITKSKPPLPNEKPTVCDDCPKKSDCYMNNGFRQACNHKHIFTQQFS